MVKTLQKLYAVISFFLSASVPVLWLLKPSVVLIGWNFFSCCGEEITKHKIAATLDNQSLPRAVWNDVSRSRRRRHRWPPGTAAAVFKDVTAHGDHPLVARTSTRLLKSSRRQQVSLPGSVSKLRSHRAANINMSEFLPSFSAVF